MSLTEQYFGPTTAAPTKTGSLTEQYFGPQTPQSMRGMFPPPKPAQDFLEYAKAGWEGSASGLAARGEMPSVALSEETPWYGRAVAGLTGIAAELPLMIGGFIGGATAAAATTPVGSALAGFAASNALPAFVRSALIEAYSKGEVVDASDFVSRGMHVAWETFKAGVVGAGMGAAGVGVRAAALVKSGVAPELATKLAANPSLIASSGLSVEQAAAVRATLGAPAVSYGATGAEVMAMATLAPTLEGRLPQPHDFLDASILLFGLKASAHGARKLMDIYELTGRTPFQVVEDAKKDPTIITDTLKDIRDYIRPEERVTERRILESAEERIARLREIEEKPAFLRTADERVILADGPIVPGPDHSPALTRAIEIVNKAPFLRTQEERVFLSDMKDAGLEPVAAKAELSGADKEAVHGLLRAELDRLGLQDIALELEARIADGRADALYSNGVIRLALDTPVEDRVGALNHEVVHALRDSGVITSAEWGALEARAKRERWVTNRKLHPSGKSVRERYAALIERGEMDEVGLLEEAIADANRALREGRIKDPGGALGKFNDKFHRFIEAFANSLRGRGFITARDVLERIQSGEVGQRLGVGEERAPRFSLRASEAERRAIGAQRQERQRIMRVPELTGKELDGLVSAAAETGIPPEVLRRNIERTKSAFPYSQGWDRLEFVRVKQTEGGEPQYVYKKIPYSFDRANGEGLTKGTPEYDARVNVLANLLVDEASYLHNWSNKGDRIARTILSHASWYRAMRAEIRRGFGGLGDLFADLLGATSPQTPVRENYRNSIDILRRATKGEFDALMPRWEAWVDRVDTMQADLLSWFNERRADGLSKKAIKENAEFRERYAALAEARELPDDLNPRKETGAKYGVNGRNVVRALVDLWRTIKESNPDIGVGANAPKALNFSGNLSGFRRGATIDVWAARLLQRLVGARRIPSPAEGAVAGSMLPSGETTGAFGLGQDVFAAATARLRNDPRLAKAFGELNPDDLQAIVWFLEKELWTENGWTSVAGEGGSFEVEARLAGSTQGRRIAELRKVLDSSKSTADQKARAGVELATLERSVDRYNISLSEQMSKDTNGVDYVPVDADMQRLQNDLHGSIYQATSGARVIASKVMPTEGRYGAPERSIDLELVTQEGFNPDAVWLTALQKAQRAHQDATYMSRVLRTDETYDPQIHRPGVEVYFKRAITGERLEEVLVEINKVWPDGYTVVVDGRRTPSALSGKMGPGVGVRIHYVPEFLQRFGIDDFTGLSDAEIAVKIEGKAAELQTIAARLATEVPEVTFAGMFWHETEVAFKHQFQEKIDAISSRIPSQDAAEAGGAIWRGQSIRSGIESAVVRADPAQPAEGVARPVFGRDEVGSREPSLDDPAGKFAFRANAEEQGYDTRTTWYHVTESDISAFDLGKTRGRLRAVFLTQSQDFANQFLNTRDVREGGDNVMPLWVKRGNFFDADNPQHLNRLRAWFSEMYPDKPAQDANNFVLDASRGEWSSIEGDPRMRSFLRLEHFDGAYVKEFGEKNLAVFNPADVKSAIGNQGTFDSRTTDIRHSLRGDEDRMASREGELRLPRAYQSAIRQTIERDAFPKGIDAVKLKDLIDNPEGKLPDSKEENYINFRYVEGPDALKALHASVSDHFEAEIQAARKAPESWGATFEKAAKYIRGDGSVDSIAVRQAASNAIVRSAATDALAAMEAVKADAARNAGVVSPEILQRQETAMQMLVAAEAMDQGLGADIARALNARKAMKQSTELAAQISGARYRFGGDPVKLAEMFDRLDTADKVAQLAKAAQKATYWQMIVEAWKAALVSGIVTHVTNLFGTELYAFMRVPVDAAAALSGMMRGAQVGLGEGQRLSVWSPVFRLIGMMQGHADGAKVALETFTVGDLSGKAEHFQEAIPGTAGTIIRTPFRMLSAEDAFVKTVIRRGTQMELAATKAIGEGLAPFSREFTERINELMTKPDAAMLEQIEKEGLRFTFNTPYGPKGRSVAQFVREWRLQWVVPFLRTPMNIAEEMLRMSAFAPLVTSWREAILKGGIERDRALAELMIGGSVMALTMAYAFSGNVSGAGSPDPGRRRAQYAAGWQPYSAKIGDTWYSYSRLQPVGTLMGIASDLSEVWDQMGDEERDQTAKMLAVAFANAITNQTFLQGIAQFTSALSDPDRYGTSLVRNLTASLVPNLIAQPTAIADPLAREINSTIDAVKARIPGMRQTLQPKVDLFGQDIQARERMFGITPVQVQKISTDKVRTELNRLGVGAPVTPKKVHVGRGTGKFGVTELSPEQRTTYARASGEFAYRILSPVVNQPTWDAMPDYLKRRMFQRVMAGAHRMGAIAALPPELRQGILFEAAQKLQEAMTQ